MKPCLLLDFITNLSGASDDDNPAQAGPVMALPEPPDIMDHRHVAGLDTSVIRIDRPVPAYRGVFETFSLLFGNQLRDIGLSGALIAFRRQRVVGLPVDHLLRDAALAAHGADGDNRSYDLQHLRQLGDRDDFVGLRRHLHLTQYQPLAGREGRNPVDRGLAGFFVVRSAHGLAIDGDKALGPSGSCRDPGDKAALERHGVQCGENVAEMVLGWLAITVRAETPLDPGEAIRARQYREGAQKQDLIERMGHLGGLARIGTVLETLPFPRKPFRSWSRCPCRCPSNRIQRDVIDSALQPFVT